MTSTPDVRPAAAADPSWWPWRAWRSPAFYGSTAHLALDLPVSLVAAALLVPLAVAVVLVPVLLVGLLLLVPTLWVIGLLAGLERRRFGLTVGLVIADPRPRPRRAGWRSLVSVVADPTIWRAALYFFLMVPIGVITAGLVIAAWSGSIALVLLPAYFPSIDSGVVDLGLVTVRSLPQSLAVALLAFIAAAALLPTLTRALTGVDVALARGLLGQDRTELTERVVELTVSRSRVVDAAEQERRRMERDLHDGAQQRLVAMSMTVGRLSTRLRRAGDTESLALADEAQGEVRLAIAELRDLTRGLHPPVLTDRGLDAALSAVAARCPVPVTVSVELPERPSLTLESIAYFFVSEALTNVAKHASAGRAAVSIRGDGVTLRVTVTDDGRGGADPHRGTGLTGLADRATGVDGTLTVSSPPGGPTVVEMELPCAS